MDVEVIPGETVTVPDAEVSEPEVKEAKIVYESDLRAGAHRNGRAPDLVGAEVASGSGDVPPELPEEPSFGGRLPERGETPPLLAYSLAFIYLGAGCLAFYVGITMLRDLRKKKE